MGNRLGTGLEADESVDDMLVVTGVVITSTVETTATGLATVSAAVETPNVTAGSVNPLLIDVPSEILVTTATSSIFFFSFTCEIGATIVST